MPRIRYPLIVLGTTRDSGPQPDSINSRGNAIGPVIHHRGGLAEGSSSLSHVKPHSLKRKGVAQKNSHSEVTANRVEILEPATRLGSSADESIGCAGFLAKQVSFVRSISSGPGSMCAAHGQHFLILSSRHGSSTHPDNNSTGRHPWLQVRDGTLLHRWQSS